MKTPLREHPDENVHGNYIKIYISVTSVANIIPFHKITNKLYS